MTEIRKLKVTCVERTYKVQGERVVYIIKAKREFDEGLTEKLLHEDMELKTFLAEYEIEKVEERDAAELKKIPTRTIEIAENKNIGKNLEIPTPAQRMSIIVQDLPEEFALEDIVKYYKERNEKHDIARLKTRFSYSLAYLTKLGIIEFINTDVNRRYRRYRKVEGAYEKMLKLTEEQKMPLEMTQ